MEPDVEIPLEIVSSWARFVPLVLPLLSLTLAFMQQSTGSVDAMLSILHLFSNPIDSLCSIFCRQEAIQQSYFFAMTHFADVAREMAAILAIYEPWQDCQRQIRTAVRARRQIIHDAMTRREKFLIRQSSRRLRACRNDGTMHAAIATATYIVSVAIICWKVAHFGQQGAVDVLRFVAMSAHLLLAIRINGRTGTYVFHDEAIRVVFELCKELEGIARAEELPPLLDRPAVNAAGSDDLTESSQYINSLNSLVYASGRLNCVYPWKIGLKITPALAVAISCTGAILFSNLTSDSTAMTMALGCLSTWILNGLLSVGFAVLLRRQRINTRTYSRLLLITDSAIAIGLVSCASFSTKARTAKVDTSIVDMITWQILLLSQIVLLFALEICSQRGIDVRHIFVRTSDEAMADHEATSRIV